MDDSDIETSCIGGFTIVALSNPVGGKQRTLIARHLKSMIRTRFSWSAVPQRLSEKSDWHRRPDRCGHPVHAKNSGMLMTATTATQICREV
jgi:hypothetical protein